MYGPKAVFLSNRKDCWTKGLPHRGLKCSYNQAFFSGILQAPIAYLSHSKKISLKKEDIINWWHVMSGGATWTSRWQLAKGWVWSHRSLATSLRLHQAVSEASPQPGNNNTLIKYRKWDHIWQWRDRRGIKTFSYRCTFNISTSKAHLSMWRVLKRTSAVFLFKSWKKNIWKLVGKVTEGITLKPHWVSLTVFTAKTHTHAWKPILKKTFKQLNEQSSVLVQ